MPAADGARPERPQGRPASRAPIKFVRAAPVPTSSQAVKGTVTSSSQRALAGGEMMRIAIERGG